MKNFDLKTAWGVHRKKGEHIQFHKHDFYELVYYCSGSGKGCLEKDSYVFSPESFVLIPPYAKHDELLYLDSDVLCIGFTTDEAFAFGQYADAQGRICRIARAIMQEVIEQPALYKDMILAKGVELLIEIRRLERPHSHYTTKNFEYIINYIAQNYHEKLMLKDMAQQMHISYDYFQHRFKEIVGGVPPAVPGPQTGGSRRRPAGRRYLKLHRDCLPVWFLQLCTVLGHLQAGKRDHPPPVPAGRKSAMKGRFLPRPTLLILHENGKMK